MALAVNDLIQITDVQTLYGQSVLNVYHYRMVALEPLVDYNDLDVAFDSIVLSVVETCQSGAVTHTRLIIQNLTNGLDIYEGIHSETGDRAANAASSILAYGFRLNRTTALTRHGHKRIAGVDEGDLVGNDPVALFKTSNLDLAATAFAADIVRTGTVDHDLVAEPVIIGRFPQGHAQAGQLDLSKVNPVASAQFIRVTSQTTRRAGRGV